MPPKKSKGGLDIVPGDGRTKQQQEEEELKKMQEMMQQMFNTTHTTKPKPTKNKKAVAQRHKNDESLAQKRAAAERAFELAHAKLCEAAMYVNQFVELKEGVEWFSVGKNKWVRYEQFKPEYLKPIVDLLTVSLSEPYNAFTYKYFLSGWPDLGICAFGVESESQPSADVKGELIGTAVSKVSRKHATKPLRGYIAMLAVAESFRGFRLGQRLVTLTVDLMKQKKVEEVCLETPTSNERALKLYLNLGFVKHKYLTKYYLDGQDAVRLKLWLSSPFEQPDMNDSLRNAFAEFQRTVANMRALDGDVQDPRMAHAE